MDSFEQWMNKKSLSKDDIDDILNPKNLDHYNHFKKFYRKYRKDIFKTKNYLYLTLSPDKFLRNLENTETNREALKRWASHWFEHNPKYYGDYAWVAEAGPDDNHLHLHCVAELKSSHKHAEHLKRSWARTFPNNQLITTVNLQSKGGKRGEYAYLQFNRPEILKDKLDYFENEKKGIHQNHTDYGLRFSRGFFLT